MKLGSAPQSPLPVGGGLFLFLALKSPGLTEGEGVAGGLAGTGPAVDVVKPPDLR